MAHWENHSYLSEITGPRKNKLGQICNQYMDKVDLRNSSIVKKRIIQLYKDGNIISPFNHINDSTVRLNLEGVAFIFRGKDLIETFIPRHETQVKLGLREANFISKTLEDNIFPIALIEGEKLSKIGSKDEYSMYALRDLERDLGFTLRHISEKLYEGKSVEEVIWDKEQYKKRRTIVICDPEKRFRVSYPEPITNVHGVGWGSS